MAVKINSLEKVMKRLGIQKGGPAHAFFTDLCYKKMDKFVPMSGSDSETSLRNTTLVTVDTITYMSNYASYQYFGKRKDGSHKVKHWTTPGTGPKWDKRMISADMKTITKDVGKYVKKYGGN